MKGGVVTVNGAVIPQTELAHAVVDGVPRLLVEPERPGVVTEAVIRLLANDGLRTSMSAAGREAALARFDADRVADVYVRAYEAALAGLRSRRRPAATRR